MKAASVKPVRCAIYTRVSPSLTSESGTEFFDAETEGPDPPFCLAETEAETRANSKKPAVHGTNARITRGVRYLKTGWWR